jgi:cysteine synthase
MAPSNADLVRDALAVYRREGFAALAEFADPQIQIRMGYGINAGEYHGIEQALRFNADWDDAWAETVYEVAEVDEIDAEHVVARIEMLMRGGGSGAEVTGTQWWLFELRDGLFVRWHLYDDRESALAAARDG